MTRDDIDRALFIRFSGLHRDAIRLVEHLIGSGQLVLAELGRGECCLAPPDLWGNGNDVRFQTMGLPSDEDVISKPLGDRQRHSEESNADPHLSEARAPFYDASLGAGATVGVPAPPGGMLDPLEEGIKSTVRMLDDGAVDPANTSSSIRMILLEHLRSLLAAQLKRVTTHE